jgi:hypothetical protein
MKKIAGIISLIGCCAAIIFCVYALYFELMEYNEDRITQPIDLTKNLLIAGLCIIPWALGIYYTIATRFGAIEPAVLQHLEKENNFIRKQIEKRELLVKLENLEKK